MTLEQVFSFCSTLSLMGWAGLVVAPRWHITRDWAAPVIAPLTLGLLYIWLMTNNFHLAPAESGFGSLAEVTALFAVPELVLAGWIHYLAFDLFVGAWELKDSQEEGIHHFAVVPCLALTLMAGPAGLVLYWIVKLAYRSARRSQVGSA